MVVFTRSHYIKLYLQEDGTYLRQEISYKDETSQSLFPSFEEEQEQRDHIANLFEEQINPMVDNNNN